MRVVEGRLGGLYEEEFWMIGECKVWLLYTIRFGLCKLVLSLVLGRGLVSFSCSFFWDVDYVFILEVYGLG